MQQSLFYEMFKRAERFSLEEFTDEDVDEEGIDVPELTEEEFAQEGIVTAIAGDIGRDFTDAYKEVKGWMLGVESKRRYIDEQCLDTIEWLKEEDRDNPRLNLDMGKFKTWMKTSETFLTYNMKNLKRCRNETKDNDHRRNYRKVYSKTRS